MIISPRDGVVATCTIQFPEKRCKTTEQNNNSTQEYPPYHVHPESFKHSWVIIGNSEAVLLHEGDGRTSRSLPVVGLEVYNTDQGWLDVGTGHPLEELGHTDQTPSKLKRVNTRMS